MYLPPDPYIWTGRNDGAGRNDLWHQVMRFEDLDKQLDEERGVVLLGFCSDEGVKRNLGRAGAKEGPDTIRKSLCNLAFHFSEEDGTLSDGGNIMVEGEDLEGGQVALVAKTSVIISSGRFPILVGGGHEISYGHVKAVAELFAGERIGVINFDPHFDLREYPQGPHSGSWARQLFEDHGQFRYLPIGINEAVNIPLMFDLMREKEQSFITMDELFSSSQDGLISQIHAFIASVDRVCLTLDLDVFSAGIAPGVSAINPYGAFPQHIRPLIREVLRSGKLVSFDVAEMNPAFDDGRTAKLAASFIYEVVMGAIR